ncbi:DedD protein [Gammaproteobacteria bacterium]
MEDNRLKHRLVGATVLVALGVVFFPLWLDMRPGPGTRLEKTNIPARPQWHFFKSEEEEHQAVVTPPPAAVPEAPVVAAPPASPPPAVSGPTVPEPPPVAAEAQPSPLPSPPSSRSGVYTAEIKAGTSLYSAFAKADVGSDQVRALLKLGPSVKTLETLQSGRSLWIKAGSQKELQELIYYGPEHKVYTHVIRRSGHLQLADSASAARILTQGATTEGKAVPETAGKSANTALAKSQHPAITPATPHPVPAKQPTHEIAHYAPPETTRPPVETRRVESPPVTPLAPVVRPPESSYPPVHSSSSPSHASPASAWVVQIASLNREENARALRDSLRSKGFPAFLESLYDGTNKRWRVRVGPSTERAEVDTLRARLERDAHLPGQVLPYP